MKSPLSGHDARRIAAEAAVWDGTVRRYFKGLPVRSTCVARIEEAIRSLQLRDVHVPSPARRQGRSR